MLIHVSVVAVIVTNMFAGKARTRSTLELSRKNCAMSFYYNTFNDDDALRGSSRKSWDGYSGTETDGPSPVAS